jgi:hypothetical protein
MLHGASIIFLNQIYLPFIAIHMFHVASGLYYNSIINP